MKVIKAAEVLAGHLNGYICYLTPQEAKAIVALTGSCAPAGGDGAVYTNAIFQALAAKSVPYVSIIGGAVISVTGNIE